MKLLYVHEILTNAALRWEVVNVIEIYRFIRQKKSSFYLLFNNIVESRIPVACSALTDRRTFSKAAQQYRKQLEYIPKLRASTTSGMPCLANILLIQPRVPTVCLQPSSTPECKLRHPLIEYPCWPLNCTFQKNSASRFDFGQPADNKSFGILTQFLVALYEHGP